ncbi:MAG TPA: FKBP-type peptidyl-prolyl cis-trans isomerase [Cyclobacteriaceae bacterium]|nr:FKBP-type peptidyl-prolyl cis-trans isomerase [Cyclobacteriaceae bacterium]
MKRIFPFVAVVVSCCVVSCNKHTELDFNAQLQKDIATIDSYLASHNINATQDPSGIRYVITSVGTGLKPTVDATISVKYTGRFLPSLDIFDQPTTGVDLDLSKLIDGWKIAIPLMTKGSLFTLYIPSGLAYGSAGANGIVSANANVMYQIELLDDDARLAADVATIDAFLLDSLHTNPDSIHKDPSGLRYVFALKGTGPRAISTSTVIVKYTGKMLPSQKVFTSASEQSTASQLPLSSLIRGWQIGIPLIPEGSQVTFYFPSSLAFGSTGRPDDAIVIPPNTNIIFDINLISAN